MRIIYINKDKLTGRMAQHIYGWTIVFMFSLVGPLVVGIDLGYALQFAVMFVVFNIIPVYQHFYVLKKYFYNKKYYPYVALLLLIIIVNSFLNDFLYSLLYTWDKPTVDWFVDIPAVLVITTAVKLVRDGYRQRLRLNQLESKQLEAELSALKSQLNPHFLFNNLNNLYAMSMDYPEPLSKYIFKLSELLRFVINSSGKQKITLKEECDFINNYIETEMLRLRENSKVNTMINCEDENKLIAPLIFLPFIENIFKHGINPNTGALEAVVEVKTFDDNLYFLTSNKTYNYVNQDCSNDKKIGLDNIKQRLNLLYPTSHKLSIVNEGQYFKVSLKLEL